LHWDLTYSAIGVSFPETARANTVLNFDATNQASYTPDISSSDPTQNTTQPWAAAVHSRILENDATHVKGKF
jgi:hypothetical protein